MRHDFDAIPEASSQRERGGNVLARIYRDIGLAAVADALDLPSGDFDFEVRHSLERGGPDPFPPTPLHAWAESGV